MEHASPGVLVLIVLFVGPILYFIRKAKNGAEFFIRRIPGIDAIDEAIGRAVELGRPLAYTNGTTNVSPLMYACLGVLKYVARKVAVFGSRIFVPANDAEALALYDATLQSAYRSANKLSSYDPSCIRFLSSEQFAYASGYQGIVHREQVAAAFLMGSFAAESLILAEAGQQIGAIQVAGTVSAEQIPFFITSCDYTLIGEELYAAGAYLSRDPIQTGSLRGQDMIKVALLGLIVVGIIQATYFSIQGDQAQVKETPLARWIQQPWSGTPNE